MNPLILRVAAVLVFTAAVFTAGWKINDWRRDSQEYTIQLAAEKASQAATGAAVAAIGGLRPKFTTINKGVEREIHTEVRYRECVHTPAAWGLLDQAYQAAGGEPFGSGTGVPAPTPAP